MDAYDLSEQTAVVTGAASGIGRAIARTLANAGVAVTVADIREKPREGGQPTHERIEADGGQAQFIETDMADIDQVRTLVDETVASFGSLDIMVNNAGVYTGSQPIEQVDEDAYEWLMDINLRGVIFGCQAAIEAMRAQDDPGSIINVSSIAGLVGFPDSALYCASKGAIANLSRELALEVGPDGIRVNAINPGVIETAMTTEDTQAAGAMTEQIPLRRDGVPEDIANAALYLASDASSYVTGHNLVVDGGYTAG